MSNFFLTILLFSVTLSNAQSVAINTTGAVANTNSILDVEATNKGILLPRVNLVSITANNVNTFGISATPITSLLVYNTTASANFQLGYYYWEGTKWVMLNIVNNNSWLLSGNSGTTAANFIGTTDNNNVNLKRNSIASGVIGISNTAYGFKSLLNNTSADRNTAIGVSALETTTTGDNNTAIGYGALFSTTTGFGNAATSSLSLYSNTTGYLNCAFGYQALFFNTTGGENTAVGFGALLRNTSAYYNTAIGARALYENTTGYQNTAIGYQALDSNTTGTANTATGFEALHNNISGNFITANGFRALRYNTTGYNNTATGTDALLLNKTGNLNTATGTLALAFNTTGSQNTAVGYNALYDNTKGDNNTAIGYYAGFNFTTTTNNNTFLGAETDATATGLANITAIGYNAKVNAANKIRLGDANVTVIEGQVAYSFPSDARFKYNINENVPGLNFIKALKPVTYNFDTKKYQQHLIQNMSDSLQKISFKNNNFIAASNVLHSGFLAQDIETICKKLDYQFDGLHIPDPNNKTDHYSLAYSQFIMPLVKGMQEQQVQIEKQQATIDMLKAQNTSFLKRLELLEKK
jgi:trimeric autotransporter adhesin